MQKVQALQQPPNLTQVQKVQALPPQEGQPTLTFSKPQTEIKYYSQEESLIERFTNESNESGDSLQTIDMNTLKNVNIPQLQQLIKDVSAEINDLDNFFKGECGNLNSDSKNLKLCQDICYSGNFARTKFRL